MDRAKVAAIMADPEFDASQWFGEALVDYVATHANELLKYPACRRLLIPVMDRYDLGELIRHRRDSEEEMVLIIDDAVKRAAQFEEQDREYWYIQLYSYDLNCTYQYIAKQRMREVFSDKFIANATIEDLKNAFQNWLITKINWATILNRFTNEDLLIFANQNTLENILGISYPGTEYILNHDSGYVHARGFQHAYSMIIEKATSINTIETIYKFLLEADLTKVYGWQNKPRGSRVIGINSRMCICGHMATSQPGATLHSKSCNRSGRTRRSLVTDIEKRLVRAL